MNGATTYRLEVEDIQGHSVISAILPSDTTRYRGPSWLRDRIGVAIARWRVIAFDQQGKQLFASDWLILRFA